MNVFINGLLTGLVLQMAIGPVFFFILNLTLRASLSDGLAGVVAVTLVDYFYITLSILGVGKILEQKNVKNAFGILSSVVLMLFGAFIIYGAMDMHAPITINGDASTIVASFSATFLFTISSPMTIVWYTGLFTAKAVEYHYTKKQLVLFGVAVGLATLLFMGTSVVLCSLIQKSVPTALNQILNGVVGGILIIYGIRRLQSLLINRT